MVEARLTTSVKYCLWVPVFHFRTKLMYPAARSLCDSWASCLPSFLPLPELTSGHSALCQWRKTSCGVAQLRYQSLPAKLYTVVGQRQRACRDRMQFHHVVSTAGARCLGQKTFKCRLYTYFHRDQAPLTHSRCSPFTAYIRGRNAFWVMWPLYYIVSSRAANPTGPAVL